MYCVCVLFLFFLYVLGRELLVLDYNCLYFGIYWFSDFVVKLNFIEILGIFVCFFGF